MNWYGNGSHHLFKSQSRRQDLSHTTLRIAHAHQICCCRSTPRFLYVCTQVNLHMHSKQYFQDASRITCREHNTSPGPSRAGNDGSRRPSPRPRQAWGLLIQPLSWEPPVLAAWKLLVTTTKINQTVWGNAVLQDVCHHPRGDFSSKKRNTSSNGLGELCSLMTASLVRQGSHLQAHAHMLLSSPWLLLTARERRSHSSGSSLPRVQHKQQNSCSNYSPAPLPWILSL